MKKALIAVVVLAGLAGAWIFFGMAPRSGSEVDFASDYPLEEGLRWTYRGPGNVVLVREIERVVEIGGRRYWVMKYQLPVLGTKTLPLRYSEQGVVTVREGREHLLMRFPMRKGDSWTIDLPSEREIAECTVLGEEQIEYSGRKGKATKLEVRRRTREGKAIATDVEWYARGFGLVKMKVTMGLPATFVLESFGKVE